MYDKEEKAVRTHSIKLNNELANSYKVPWQHAFSRATWSMLVRKAWQEDNWRIYHHDVQHKDITRGTCIVPLADRRAPG